MPRKTTIRLHLPAASGSTMGWPELRRLMDRLAQAAAAMPGGPPRGDLTRVRFEDKCLEVHFDAPSPTSTWLEVLRRGPTRGWTQEQRKATEGFYELLRDYGEGAELGIRKMVPLKVPPKTSTWYLTEWTTLGGRVFRIGGRDDIAEITFEHDGTTDCTLDGGSADAEELAKHLHKLIRASGRATRDPFTGALLAFHIIEWELVKKPTSKDRAAVDAELAERLKDYDVTEAMKIIRG